MNNNELPFAIHIHKKGHSIVNVLFLFIYISNLTHLANPDVIYGFFPKIVVVPIP